MAIKPIIFSAPMARAVLDGRKTQTRRAIKPRNKRKAKQNEYGQGHGLWVHGYNDEHIEKLEAHGSIKDYTVSPMWIDLDMYIKKYAPYKPGDVLWVRETIWVHKEDKSNDYKNIYYDADCYEHHKEKGRWLTNWYVKKPSIHMPKEAARIFLRVTDVSVERLQKITSTDMWNEGCLPKDINQKEIGTHDVWLQKYWTPLWDGVNDKRGYPWESNP